MLTCTTDYEIITVLLDRPWLSPSELRAESRLAETSFYYTLRHLEERGTLVSRIADGDGRRKLYALSPPMHALVMQQYRGYLALSAQLTSGGGAPTSAPIRLTHDYIRRSPHTGHLTAEFQILLYLYLATRLSNLAIATFVDVSQSKFNQALRLLRDRGLVHSCPHPEDGRSRLYDLPDGVRDTLDEMHRRAAAWLSRMDAADSATPWDA